MNRLNNSIKRTLLLTSFGLMSLSATRDFDERVLAADDVRQQTLDEQRGPMLSSGFDQEPQWESYAQWNCFEASAARMECTEFTDGAEPVPILTLNNFDTLYEFSLDPEEGINCPEMLNQLQSLMLDRKTVCVYAAKLQALDNTEGFQNHELWIMKTVKTLNGYWTWEPGDGVRRLDQFDEESHTKNLDPNELEPDP